MEILALAAWTITQALLQPNTRREGLGAGRRTGATVSSRAIVKA